MQNSEGSREPPSGQAELSPEEALASRGQRWVWVGGIVTALSLIARQPFRGPGALGRQWIILTVLGLFTIGIGLIAMFWHSEWRTIIKAALVSLALGAIWAFSSFVVPTVHNCSEIAYPNLENPKRVYCQQSSGTFLRISISNIRYCPDGSRIYDTREEIWSGNGWYAEGPGTGCPL